jgi:hypothetical protein
VRGSDPSVFDASIVEIFGGGISLSLGRTVFIVADGEHGTVDADFAAALRGDAVAARDLQSHVRRVGAHDHRRRLRLLPPLPTPAHRAFLILSHNS